jgi:protein-S-isoprenylcysteine O-methyltransferase Ste14
LSGLLLPDSAIYSEFLQYEKTMRMIQEMQAQGQWLFRWRSYLPLVFLILFIPAFGDYRYLFGNNTADLIWEAVCLFIGLFGVAIRCLVIGYVPQNTSGRNTKQQVADTLNTNGMYSLLRNPLYLGNFFIGAAPILFFHTWWLCVIYVLTFILYYERIIVMEEAFLSDKFGDDYVQWSLQTPALFPKHLRWRKPDLPFSWKHTLRREYHGLFGLIVIMSALEFVSDICVQRAVIFDPVWTVIFTAGAVFYLFVRCLVKYTRPICRGAMT